jgi:NAD(P)-dependent dehydrogenase (short-subunit alcohol dehydrogenase family)
MATDGSFAGKTALITGGASGIGRALGAALVERGARVVLVDVDGEAAKRAAAELTGGTGSAGAVTGVPVDVTDRDAVQAATDDVIGRHGAIDLLFNNAGISMGGPTHGLTAAHWDRAVDVNLRGVINGILAVYPHMVQRRQGHIVNTASGAGLVAPPFVVPYAATKHAVVGLSTGLRPEAALHGVRVSVLCPGMVETPVLDRLPPPELPEVPWEPVTPRRYLARLRQKPVPADEFARAALHGVARNRSIIVVPRRANLLWYLNRLSPAVVERISARIAVTVDRDLIRPRPSV